MLWAYVYDCISPRSPADNRNPVAALPLPTAKSADLAEQADAFVHAAIETHKDPALKKMADPG